MVLFLRKVMKEILNSESIEQESNNKIKNKESVSESGVLFFITGVLFVLFGILMEPFVSKDGVLVFIKIVGYIAFMWGCLKLKKVAS